MHAQNVATILHNATCACFVNAVSRANGSIKQLLCLVHWLLLSVVSFEVAKDAKEH